MARILACVVLACISLPSFATNGDAAVMAQRMLDALGGRAAWAGATNSVNDSQQNWDGEPSVLRVVITMDFDRPRMRIETRGEGLHLVRVIDGERHWRLTRDGQVAPVSDETLATDRRWYQGHIYRTLHRIAKGDPALALAVAPDGRLEVREGGTRIAWYRLDRVGQPYAYGSHDDDTGAIFGPWDTQAAGVRHPVWVARDGGKWRAMLKRLEVNVRLDEGLFARPAG